MFKKSFVSIAFSTQKIEILKLDSSRKKIETAVSVPLPQGTIINREIKKPSELTQIIASSWKKFKIYEKSVGIVVPEFLTYTKSISLPSLTVPELDEAVRWQSKDFLPGQSGDIVLDWKIIKKDKSNYQILVVAIQKSVLTSYVDVVEKAGLYPLVVETPSLSLTRIASCGDKGCMIIYVKTDETIIVISQNNSIVASSLASSTSQNEIITTAARMLNHYSSTQVHMILIGGVGLSQAFIKNVSTYLNKQFQPLDIKIAGLSQEQVQDYLIPLSLQFKDPAEPESENTVNLLPPNWAKKYKSQRTYSKYWSMSLLSSFIMWATFLSLLSVFVLLNQKVSVLKNKSTSSAVSTEDKSTKTINEINSLSKKVINSFENTTTPESLINLISSQKPSSIRIQKYDLNIEDGQILIEGVSDSRQSLLAFKESLTKLNEVESVNLPISNLISEGPITFSINLTTKVSGQQKPVPKLKL